VLTLAGLEGRSGLGQALEAMLWAKDAGWAGLGAIIVCAMRYQPGHGRAPVSVMQPYCEVPPPASSSARAACQALELSREVTRAVLPGQRWTRADWSTNRRVTRRSSPWICTSVDRSAHGHGVRPGLVIAWRFWPWTGRYAYPVPPSSAPNPGGACSCSCASGRAVPPHTRTSCIRGLMIPCTRYADCHREQLGVWPPVQLAVLRVSDAPRREARDAPGGCSVVRDQHPMGFDGAPMAEGIIFLCTAALGVLLVPRLNGSQLSGHARYFAGRRGAGGGGVAAGHCRAFADRGRHR